MPTMTTFNRAVTPASADGVGNAPSRTSLAPKMNAALCFPASRWGGGGDAEREEGERDDAAAAAAVAGWRWQGRVCSALRCGPSPIPPPLLPPLLRLLRLLPPLCRFASLRASSCVGLARDKYVANCSSYYSFSAVVGCTVSSAGGVLAITRTASSIPPGNTPAALAP